MKSAFVLGLVALTMLPVAAVTAAPAVRSVMHAWRADAQTAHDMLSGYQAFDAAAMRRILQTYAGDARSLAAEVHGSSGGARAFRARMTTFQADAEAALPDAADRTAMRGHFARLIGECRSCHNAFN